MNVGRKIHSHSVLKNLSARKQAEIIAHTDGPGGNSYVETAAWLQKDGIPATAEMISKFRDSYLLFQEFKASEEFALEMTRLCKESGWVKTAEEERAAAQMFFNRAVLKKRDPKMWSMVERVNLLKDKVELDRKRLKLEMKERKGKAAKNRKIEESGLSAEEKEAAIRQIYGMS